MKNENVELCSALLTIGTEGRAVEYIRSEILDRLAGLGLAKQIAGHWKLTDAGIKLFPALESGDALPNLA
jgi:hypothetical protein